MIVEYIRYTLSAHSADALIEAYVRASAHLRQAPECLGYSLSQCEDAPATFILRIEWRSREAHMDGFRRGEHFKPFLAAIGPFVEEIAEMRHYALTEVNWRR